MPIHPRRVWHRLLAAFAYIQRDSIIYPTPLRVRLFAWGGLFCLTWLTAHLYLNHEPDPTVYVVLGAAALLLALLLWRNRGEGDRAADSVGLYAFCLWFVLPFGSGWIYVASHFAHFELLLTLMAMSTYYLMAEWKHAFFSLLMVSVVSLLLMALLGRPIVMPPASHWVLLGLCNVAWCAYSMSNRSLRVQRLSEAQSLVRHIQRGLQPGLQSMEGLVPEFYEAARWVENEAAGQRIIKIAKRFKANAAGMQDYLDLQSINARFLSLDGRQRALRASQVVQEVVASYPYAKKSLREAVSVEVEQDFRFAGSAEAWSVVWRNLLDNAVCALQVRPSRALPHDVSIRISCKDGVGRMSIVDHGLGISPHALPYVFEPFFTHGAQAGLGLGLSYCKTVVEGSQGQIRAASALGGGTRLDVVLPYCQAVTGLGG